MNPILALFASALLVGLLIFVFAPIAYEDWQAWKRRRSGR